MTTRYRIVTRAGTFWASHVEWGFGYLRAWGRFFSERGRPTCIAFPLAAIRYVEEQSAYPRRRRPRRSIRGQWGYLGEKRSKR